VCERRKKTPDMQGKGYGRLGVQHACFNGAGRATVYIDQEFVTQSFEIREIREFFTFFFKFVKIH